MAVTVSLLLCVVCGYMGMCYLQLSQFDAAELEFSQSLRIWTANYPPGHDNISLSEPTVSYSFCEHSLSLGIFVAERLLQQVWQLKFGQR